jgi:hypothetical protein
MKVFRLFTRVIKRNEEYRKKEMGGGRKGDRRREKGR